jgi:hypothetical protein
MRLSVPVCCIIHEAQVEIPPEAYKVVMLDVTAEREKNPT